jgi:hypothetical protein
MPERLNVGNGVTVMKSEAYEVISRGGGIESFAGEC